MRLVFAGTPDVAVTALNRLVDSEHEVVAVVTRPDAPRGRSKRLVPSPVAARAEQLGIEVLRPARPRDEDFVARLTALAPDCVPIVAYGALIPENVIAIPAHGWVNLHFSLLPRWRGAAPVQHAIIAGDDETGAATFSLVSELDAGDVYGMVREPIGPTDTAGDLLQRLAVSGADLLVLTLGSIEAGVTPTPQPEDGITLAPKITVDDARIDWQAPGVTIDRLVRGCHPNPGAWTTFRGERFKVNRVAVVPDDAAAAEPAPGELSVTRRSVLVGTGDGALELLDVRPSGRRDMRAADWARGAGLAPGEGLGS